MPLVALALCGMLIVQGAYIGTQPAVFAELFPAAVRYSGTSLANTLGTIVGGAPAPFIAAALYQATGTSLGSSQPKSAAACDRGRHRSA